MPININNLALATNDDGKGVLNSLAHRIVARLREMDVNQLAHPNLQPEGSSALLHRIYAKYCQKLVEDAGQGGGAAGGAAAAVARPSDKEFLEFIQSAACGPVEAEKLLTPLLERMRGAAPLPALVAPLPGVENAPYMQDLWVAWDLGFETEMTTTVKKFARHLLKVENKPNPTDAEMAVKQKEIMDTALARRGILLANANEQIDLMHYFLGFPLRQQPANLPLFGTYLDDDGVCSFVLPQTGPQLHNNEPNYRLAVRAHNKVMKDHIMASIPAVPAANGDPAVGADANAGQNSMATPAGWTGMFQSMFGFLGVVVQGIKQIFEMFTGNKSKEKPVVSLTSEQLNEHPLAPLFEGFAAELPDCDRTVLVASWNKAIAQYNETGKNNAIATAFAELKNKLASGGLKEHIVELDFRLCLEHLTSSEKTHYLAEWQKTPWDTALLDKLHKAMAAKGFYVEVDEAVQSQETAALAQSCADDEELAANNDPKLSSIYDALLGELRGIPLCEAERVQPGFAKVHYELREQVLNMVTTHNKAQEKDRVERDKLNAEIKKLEEKIETEQAELKTVTDELAANNLLLDHPGAGLIAQVAAAAAPGPVPLALQQQHDAAMAKWQELTNKQLQLNQRITASQEALVPPPAGPMGAPPPPGLIARRDVVQQRMINRVTNAQMIQLQQNIQNLPAYQAYILAKPAAEAKIAAENANNLAERMAAVQEQHAVQAAAAAGLIGWQNNLPAGAWTPFKDKHAADALAEIKKAKELAAAALAAAMNGAPAPV